MYLPVKIIKIVPKMSFPPGPPLPIPGLPPPMIPPPYGVVPPMGPMIPMTVGMMPAPMMGHVAMTMPAPLPMPPQPKMTIKRPPSHFNTMLKRENQETPEIMKGPPVTVFVGNITDRAADNLVRQILQRCGIVLNWKRVQGANGKLQAFGFCEYGEPEAALRAIRLLHDYELGNKKLVVKVDAKTKEKLDEYKAKVWSKKEVKKDGKEGDKEDGEDADELTPDILTQQRDEIIKSSLETLVKQHEVELSKPAEPEGSPPPQPIIHPVINHSKPANQENSPKPIMSYGNKKTELDEMDLEEDKKSLIHREIDKFRDTYKRAEEEKEKEKDRSSSRSSRRRDYDSPEPSRVRDRDRDRERDRDRDRDRERDRERRHRERVKEDNSSHRQQRSRERRSPRTSPNLRENRDRSRERERDRPERERPVERSRSISRDKDWMRERERERDREREREHSNESRKDKEYDKEEEEEAYERKKLERKLREKEAVYQERLRNWEARERRKLKDYEKEKMKTEEQKRDETKEARRLKEFLEDYDDERDDPKYFKGNALLRRMKEREKEIDEDLLDRQREKEELDELRRKLIEEGHPDPEAEVERFLQEESRLADISFKEQTPESEPEPEKEPPRAKMKPISNTPASPVESHEIIKQPRERKLATEDDNTQNSFSAFSDLILHEEAKPLGFTSLRIGGSPTQNTATSPAATHNNTGGGVSKRKLTVDEVFNANDEDETEHKKKRKLIPLDDSQEDSAKTPSAISQMSVEEKRKHIKNLIEKIPTEKNKLFAYTLDWTMVDKVLMEKRIRPWINKKIIEYIGEEEPTLVEFICSKVMMGSDAQSILDDVSMMLQNMVQFPSKTFFKKAYIRRANAQSGIVSSNDHEVLDDEAEVFVVKMWRLLIYEIEAKKLGLPENSSLGKS